VQTLILNEIEGEALTGETEPDRIVDALLSRPYGREVVLTLGTRGVIYGEAARRIRRGIFPVPVEDTTAAGDTFTGYFLATEDRDVTVEMRLQYAAAAAALCVSRAGAADSIPTWIEVERFLKDRNR
jgi:ribokinase